MGRTAAAINVWNLHKINGIVNHSYLGEKARTWKATLRTHNRWKYPRSVAKKKFETHITAVDGINRTPSLKWVCFSWQNAWIRADSNTVHFRWESPTIARKQEGKAPQFLFLLEFLGTYLKHPRPPRTIWYSIICHTGDVVSGDMVPRGVLSPLETSPPQGKYTIVPQECRQ